MVPTYYQWRYKYSSTSQATGYAAARLTVSVKGPDLPY